MIHLWTLEVSLVNETETDHEAVIDGQEATEEMTGTGIETTGGEATGEIETGTGTGTTGGSERGEAGTETDTTRIVVATEREVDISPLIFYRQLTLK